MSNIYTELILDHYQKPRNFGRIVKPTASVKVINPLCGDEMIVDILVKKKKIKKITFSGQGCAISIASASMVTEYLKKKNISQLKKINKDFIIKMLGISLGINRIKCALLILEALKKLKI